MIQVLHSEAKYIIFKVNKEQFRQGYSHMAIISPKYTADLSVKGLQPFIPDPSTQECLYSIIK